MGAPAGYAAWGGWHEGVLPARLRWASGAVGLLVFPALIAQVLAAGGVLDADWVPEWGKGGMWILVGVFTVGTISNFASRSKRERWWGFVSLAIAICCAVIALNL